MLSISKTLLQSETKIALFLVHPVYCIMVAGISKR